MADCFVTGEAFERAFVFEHLAEQSQSTVTGEMTVAAGDDACTFLAAVLKRVQSEIREFCGIGMTPDAKNAALLMQTFELSRHAHSLACCCSSRCIRGLWMIPGRYRNPACEALTGNGTCPDVTLIHYQSAAT